MQIVVINHIKVPSVPIFNFDSSGDGLSSVQKLSYIACHLIQIDPTARITSPSATILCYCSNLAIGVIDPMVYLTRRKQYREEIKILIAPAPPMRTSTEVKSRCKTTGWK